MVRESDLIVVNGRSLRREDYDRVLDELAELDLTQREAVEGYLIMQCAAAEASRNRAQRGAADAEVDLGSFIKTGYDLAAVHNAIVTRPWEHPAGEATALQRTVHSIMKDKSQHYEDLELRLYGMHDALKGVAVDIKPSNLAVYPGTADTNVLVRLSLEKERSSETCMNLYFLRIGKLDSPLDDSPLQSIRIDSLFLTYTITIAARRFFAKRRISICKRNEKIVPLSQFYDGEWGTCSVSPGSNSYGRILLAALEKVPAFVQKTLEKDREYFVDAVTQKQ